METAVGTRRSLLHDVLSQAELNELGLDSSVDDLPPLVTRLFHSSANAVYCFAWITFAGFWLSSAIVLYHVAASDPERHLPSTNHYVFLSAYCALLLCGELALYYYVRHLNVVQNVVTGRSGEVRRFSLSSKSLVSHAALSLVAHMCAFLDLIFVLHSFCLPKPMLICSSFTVMLNTGLIPFFVQLRTLTSYYRGDKFDPLECGSYIPATSIGSFFLRCFLLAVRFVSVSFSFFFKVIEKIRHCCVGTTRYLVLCARGAAYRFSRGSVRTSPVRRVIPDCCGPSEVTVVMDEFPDHVHDSGTGRSEANSGRSCNSTSRFFQRTVWPGRSQHEEYDSNKDALLASSGAAFDTLLLKAPRGHGDASSEEVTGISAGLVQPDGGPTDNAFVETVNAGANGSTSAVVWEESQPSGHREFSAVVGPGTSVMHPALGVSEGSIHAENSSRITSIFIAPRASFTLTTCLMLLDLQALSLYFREQAPLHHLVVGIPFGVQNFLPLDQVENFEFFTSIVSILRLYSGDFCMLLYLMFATCTFGVNTYYVVFTVLLLLKLKTLCIATVITYINTAFGLWQ